MTAPRVPADAPEAAAKGLTVIVPAFNEERGIGPTLDALHEALAAIEGPHEVIVVDDGSTDETGAIARDKGCRVITHRRPGGYGYSLRDGVRAAAYETVAITDADGSYPVEELPALVADAAHYDLVIGRRVGPHYIRRAVLSPLRSALLLLTSFATGTWIPDPNSGLRVFRRAQVLPLLPQMPRGFSFTTTMTLLLSLEGRSVHFHPVHYRERIGTSKVRLIRDALLVGRTVVEVTLAHDPLKVFLVLAALPALACVPVALAARSSDTALLAATILAACAVLTVALGLVSVVVLGDRRRR